jgi:regulator of replication initiation timing
MEQEREQMMRELAEAKMQVETKTGEISIIRRKQTTITQNYDQQLAALQQSMAEEMAKHKREVEAAMSEGKVLATENIFLQQELADEAYQQRSYKSKRRAEKSAPETPRKSRVLPFRDGFDDDEIAMVSPSKSATRSKRATPTVPGKRKRQSSQDGPVPLQLSPAAGELIMPDAPDMAEVAEVKRKAAESGRHQRFMMRLLSHRTTVGEDTDFEAMVKLAFPSEPHRPMSSIIMEGMAHVEPNNYILEYTQTIASLWQRAINEKFYEPIPRFEAIMRYSLMSDDTPLSELITPLVGILQDSVEINAVPRFKYAPASRDKRVTRRTPKADLQPLVDSTGAMRLLYQVACGVLHVRSSIDEFWQNIRISFILVMLHPSHPLGDIVILMNLLSTSIRPNSFGPIRSSDQDQLDVQKWIVDRLTHMLSEPAIPDEGLDPYTPHDICAMRLEVLLLLESLAFNPMAPSQGQGHASTILALHPNALARLFRSLHDELDALYSSPPESDLRVALINGLMRLVFGVMRQHASLINMQEKLACVPGSKQKHLVVLTRLAFCDGTVLEAGIDDETVDMAHELLEEWTNPQEADSLAEVFSTSRKE